MAASQREDSEKGMTDKQPATSQQNVPVQQGTTSGTTTMTRPEQYGMRRWDPLSLFDEMQQDMARFWNQMMPWSTWPMYEPMRSSGQMVTWRPSLDVFERDNQIVVKAELPGVKKEDIELEVDRGSLVIRGQRHAEHQVRQDQYYRTERSYGSFYRRLPLPEGVNADNIKANYNDGILEVRIPKPSEEQTQGRKIPLT
jgi:HSP20 family protein